MRWRPSGVSAVHDALSRRRQPPSAQRVVHRLFTEAGTAHVEAVQRLREGLDRGGDAEVRQMPAPADVENGKLRGRCTDEVQQPRLEHRVAGERE